MQYEGIADETCGAELARCQSLYFAKFMDGRARLAWPGITYVRVRPTWIRYSDYGSKVPIIVEYSAAQLAALG